MGDVALDRLHGRARGRVRPERIDECVDGDDLTAPEHERREQRPLAARRETDLSA